MCNVRAALQSRRSAAVQQAAVFGHAAGVARHRHGHGGQHGRGGTRRVLQAEERLAAEDHAGPGVGPGPGDAGQGVVAVHPPGVRAAQVDGGPPGGVDERSPGLHRRPEPGRRRADHIQPQGAAQLRRGRRAPAAHFAVLVQGRGEFRVAPRPGT